MKKLKKKHTTKKKKSFFKKPYFWGFIFVILLFIGGFYFFFLNSYFYIDDIKVDGFDIPTESYIEKKFLFFSSRSIFFVSLNKMKEDLLNNFHEIEDVKMKRIFPNNVKVEIVRREAVASWCDEDYCIKVDNKGVMFEEGRDGEFFFYKETEKKIGEEILSREEILAMRKINNALDNVTFFIITSSKLEAYTSTGYRLYFLVSGDIERQIDNLNFTIDEEIDNIDDLQYIDLRYGNNVYYK